MPHHHRALRAARIILAGPVVASAERRPVGLRTSKDVVAIWRVATSIGRLAFFVEGRLLRQIVGSMQLGDILGNRRTFGIHPRPLANAVPGVHRSRALGRQIGMPGLCPRSGGSRELLAMTIGAGKPAKVRAFAWPGACNEER